MTQWQGLVLGAIQGVTEFLPISSSGHLMLLQNLFGMDVSESIAFGVLLHVATLLAIPTLFWREILDLFGKRRMELGMLALATVPAVIIGLIIKGTQYGKSFELLAGTVTAVGTALVFTGITLWLAGSSMKGKESSGNLTWRHALFIGVAQAVAIVPGVSRSGMTIAAAIICGVALVDAVRFSFLLAIPVIAGGAIVELKDIGALTLDTGWLPIVLGFTAAFVLGAASIRIVADAVLRERFRYFAFYCVPVGLLVILVAGGLK